MANSINMHELPWKRLLRLPPLSRIRSLSVTKKDKIKKPPAGSGLRHRIKFQMRTRQKSGIVVRDLIIVFIVFAVTLVLTSVLDLHGSFEQASLELKGSPIQYDEIIVALAVTAAALSAFAVRRWRELETEIDERLVVEDALTESEGRYRTLAEAAQDFIFILGRDGSIGYVNSFAARQLEKPLAEIVGRPGKEILPAGMAGKDKLDLMHVFDEAQPLHLELSALFSGRETWLSTALVPIFNEEGKVGSVLGIARDITERKLAEDELRRAHDVLEKAVAERTGELKSVNETLKNELEQKRQAEERLKALNRALLAASASHHALLDAAAEPELLRDICRVVVEVGGYRFAWVGFAEDDAGKTIRPVASAGYEKGFLESARMSWAETAPRGPGGEAIRTGRPSVVRDIARDPGYFSWREQARQRGYASAVALPLGKGGQTFGVLNIYASQEDAFDDEEVKLLSDMASDLAYGLGALKAKGERDNQATALKRSGEQLSLLLESLPIIFYASKADSDFGILYVSDNVQSLTGYSSDQITADASFWVDRVHPDDAPRIFEEQHEVFDGGLHEYEYRWRTVGGSYRWFLDVHHLLRRPGASEDDNIVGMWLDITSRKNGEEALLKVKEELELGAAGREQELKSARAELAARRRELETTRRREDLLGQMESVLQSCLKPAEVLAVFTRFAAQLFPGESGAVYVFNAGRQTYESAAAWGKNAPGAKRFSWPDCWSLRRQQTHVASEPAMRCRHVREKTPHVCVPLKAAGIVIGVLSLLVDAGSGAAVLDEDTAQAIAATAEEAAERLGMALYNLKLRELLKQNSIKDPFRTGLK